MASLDVHELSCSVTALKAFGLYRTMTFASRESRDAEIACLKAGLSGFSMDFPSLDLDFRWIFQGVLAFFGGSRSILKVSLSGSRGEICESRGDGGRASGHGLGG